MLTSILKMVSGDLSCSTRKMAPLVSKVNPVQIGFLNAVRAKPIAVWMTLFGIVVLAALLRLFMLSSQSLWLG